VSQILVSVGAIVLFTVGLVVGYTLKDRVWVVDEHQVTKERDAGPYRWTVYYKCKNCEQACDELDEFTDFDCHDCDCGFCDRTEVST